MERKTTFLKTIRYIAKKSHSYPFSLPCYAKNTDLELSSRVTFFVGENGTGKSTLLEAIAYQCGFNLQGGHKHHSFGNDTKPELSDNIRLSWYPRKTSDGFFMRAESFFNFASYIDEMSEHSNIHDYYGGRSLHQQSHGESFLSLFQNILDLNQKYGGIYLLDEPEAALSPQRQLTFLSILKQLTASEKAQVIIATHSPILLSFPDACIFDFDNGMVPIAYEDTEHYKLTRSFLNNPRQYLQHL